MEYFNAIINNPNFFVSIGIILNGVIAMVAILTLKKANRTYQDLKESRKAFIAPAESPGSVRLGAKATDETGVRISLKNYGVNPVSKLTTMVYFITQELTEEYYKKNINSPFDKFHCKNPLPGGTTFNIEISQETMINTKLDNSTDTYDSATSTIEGIILEVDYFDAILNSEKETTILYWIISKEGNMSEVNDNIHASYKKLFDNFKNKKGE